MGSFNNSGVGGVVGGSPASGGKFGLGSVGGAPAGGGKFGLGSVGGAPAGGGKFGLGSLGGTPSGGGKFGLGNTVGGVVGGSPAGGGGSSGGSGKKFGGTVGGVVGGVAQGGVKKTPASLNGLEAAGSVAFSKCPTNEQAWILNEAHALVAKGSFTSGDHQRLSQSAHASFPKSNAALVVALIRFKALQASAGGNLTRLYTAKSSSSLQRNLISGSI